jgi:uncharacterized protein (DUF1778 family)
MREIKGLLDQSVNTSKTMKTTHIRVQEETKRLVQEAAESYEMTVPKYMKMMVNEYIKGSFKADNL